MAFKLGIFKTPNHKVFNYQPLYYDPRKEELDEKVEMARRAETGEYVPGDMVKRAFKRNRNKSLYGFRPHSSFHSGLLQPQYEQNAITKTYRNILGKF